MEKKDIIKTDREVIMENIRRMTADMDDKTLWELERLMIGWLNLKRNIRIQQARLDV